MLVLVLMILFLCMAIFLEYLGDMGNQPYRIRSNIFCEMRNYAFQTLHDFFQLVVFKQLDVDAEDLLKVRPDHLYRFLVAEDAVESASSFDVDNSLGVLRQALEYALHGLL